MPGRRAAALDRRHPHGAGAGATPRRRPDAGRPPGLGRAFADAYAAEPWRGYGAGPPQVYALVAQGEDFEAAAASLFAGSGSYGNGAAMRAAPVALPPSHGDLAEVARRASVQARLTHAHPEAIAGAVVIAQVVVRLLEHDRPDTEVVHQVVAEVAGRSEAAPLRSGLREALELAGAQDGPRRTVSRVGTGVAAAESVPAAVAALLAGRDLLDAITTAITFGGDTDTIAAMTGAMAGAAWGLGSIPADVLARLEARTELAELAGRLRGR